MPMPPPCPTPEAGGADDEGDGVGGVEDHLPLPERSGGGRRQETGGDRTRPTTRAPERAPHRTPIDRSPEPATRAAHPRRRDGAVSDPQPDRPATREPALAPEVAGANGLRTGWTTGTCASAAAKAATLWLVHGEPPDEVEVALPSGRRVRFPVADTDPAHPHRCAVVKDAGDDPDVTDGAHLTAQVEPLEGDPSRGGAQPVEPAGRGVQAAGTGTGTGTGVVADQAETSGADALAPGTARTPPAAGDEPSPPVELRAGPGVGTVTLPGLGLPVGAPAINPVPRRMITQAVREVTDRPLRVTVSVPGGEAMAAKTSNDRLGIVGGISILGTTGIVRPFSTASYRASVVQQVDVAAAQGQRHVVLSTGSRSDRAAQRLLPELDPVCFVEVGDFTGIALRRAAGTGTIRHVTWVGMAGKIAKLAAGVLMTHYRRSKVDGELLAEVAVAGGAPAAVVEAATATATARHFAEAALAHGSREPLAELCRRAARACAAHVDGALDVEVVMVDFEGEEVIARG
jgi:cobalt-precorrin-5B (C1)-methyltransferase